MAEGEAKTPINICSISELASVPGMTKIGLAALVDAHSKHENVTAELFTSLSELSSIHGLAGSLDFSPRPAATGPKGNTTQNQCSPAQRGSPPEAGPVASSSPHAAEHYTRDAYSPSPLATQGDSSAFITPAPRHGPYLSPDYWEHTSPRRQASHWPTPDSREISGLHPPATPGPHQMGVASYHLPSARPAPRQSLAGELKNIKFDGRTRWAPFFRKFNMVAANEHWGVSECMDRLVLCLEGQALAFYDCLAERDPHIDYLLLTRQLAERFGPQETPESAQLAFANSRQGPSESLMEFLERLRDLAHVAYPLGDEHFVQGQLVARLCTGLRDTEVGFQALAQHPMTVDAAVKAIRWIWHSHEAFYGRPKKPRSIGFEREEARVNQVATPRGVATCLSPQQACLTPQRSAPPPGRSREETIADLAERMNALETTISEFVDTANANRDHRGPTLNGQGSEKQGDSRPLHQHAQWKPSQSQ